MLALNLSLSLSLSSYSHPLAQFLSISLSIVLSFFSLLLHFSLFFLWPSPSLFYTLFFLYPSPSLFVHQLPRFFVLIGFLLFVPSLEVSNRSFVYVHNNLTIKLTHTFVRHSIKWIFTMNSSGWRWPVRGWNECQVRIATQCQSCIMYILYTKLLCLLFPLNDIIFL